MQDRLLRFEHQPQHIHFLQPQFKTEKMLRRVEQELWAEWYTMGFADKLIMSDWYKGRASALGITSWAYQLKHLWYSGTSCKELALPDYGFLAYNDRACLSVDRKLPQPHLEALKKYGDFPSSWIGSNTGVIYHGVDYRPPNLY